jgi:NADH:ubiquinone oxidoreductase subunit 5 (subunit L)/multisubunit Na+/H+ antiporter MnhA subunit
MNINNVKSGIKAILYNKLGDIGIILIILYYYNLNNYLLLGFIIGCISKSAQILLSG